MSAFAWRYFGFIGFEPYGLRFRWLEMSFNRCGLALGISRWGEDSRWQLHVHLLWLNLFLTLPIKAKEPDGEMCDRWGFSFHGDDRGQVWNSLHLNWHTKTKIVYMPWMWTYHKGEVQNAFGQWVPMGSTMWDWSLKQLRGYGRYPHVDGRWVGFFDYTYTLRNGQVQHRKAAVCVERREWRWRWMMWSSWPALIRTSIDVNFDGEVGERSGSWKGGTTGCGYTMLPGETAEQCLRRMERERKFT